MQKILLMILVVLGLVLIFEFGYFVVIKQSNNKNVPLTTSSVTVPTPRLLPDEKMVKHNFDEIYKDTVDPKTDVLSSSVLTNTYQGKIIKISHKSGALEDVAYPFNLFIQLQGAKGNTKAMFFTDKQIAEMEKQGFDDVKKGDTLQVTLSYSLVSKDSSKSTTAESTATHAE
ncbi:MAG: hypothetical protein FJ009_05210 [Chloroflexi bacterium]|nr:hypothetical protein [Chloroflexota bacterium]